MKHAQQQWGIMFLSSRRNMGTFWNRNVSRDKAGDVSVTKSSGSHWAVLDKIKLIILEMSDWQQCGKWCGKDGPREPTAATWVGGNGFPGTEKRKCVAGTPRDWRCAEGAGGTQCDPRAWARGQRCSLTKETVEEQVGRATELIWFCTHCLWFADGTWKLHQVRSKLKMQIWSAKWEQG